MDLAKRLTFSFSSLPSQGTGLPRTLFSPHGCRSGFLCSAMVESIEAKEDQNLITFMTAVIGDWVSIGQSAGKAQAVYLKQAFKRSLVSNRVSQGKGHALTVSAVLNEWLDKEVGTDSHLDKACFNTIDFHAVDNRSRALTDRFTIDTKVSMLLLKITALNRRLAGIRDDENMSTYAKQIMSIKGYNRLLLAEACDYLELEPGNLSRKELLQLLAHSDEFARRPKEDKPFELEERIIDHISDAAADFWQRLKEEATAPLGTPKPPPANRAKGRKKVKGQQ